ncbi:ABC transporter ATP-binding protein [Bacillus infantis]|uniref:ABC transporter ATP-binding protein n=1 Tax=Bacillus infantis TaxID=324767 RepID=UPI003CE72369
MLLRAKGIRKTYGTKNNLFNALEHIDLEVDRGEFTGIMGPSGAGKSTLLNILASIDSPSAGSIHIKNQDILRMEEEELSRFRREQLGFIFQDFNLLDTLNVRENIALPLALSGMAFNQIDARIQKLAEWFEIERILEQYPREISGGQKQRTAAARALIANPSLLLADEPTGSLDSKSAFGLLQALQKLNAEQQATILMVTHDPLAASFCSRVLFIKDGHIFTEIRKGESDRKQFFQQIIDILAALGGGGRHDVI